MADYTKMPRRLYILRALTDHLRTITPANGYQHDLSEAVFRGRSQFGSGDPIPMLSILQSPRNEEPLPTPGQGTGHHGPLELLLQGFVGDDFDHPTDPAEMLLADVKLALGRLKDKIALAPKMHWHGIEGIEIDQGVCRPPDGEISAVAFFWLSVRLQYTDNVADPYAVPAA